MWFAVAPYDSILEPPKEVVPALVAQFIKYFPVGRLPEFVLGVVLYTFWKGGFARVAPAWTFATFIVAATIVVTHVENIPEILLHDGLTAVAWVPLVLAAANLRSGPLCSPFCVFLGRISFALYLFHLPVFNVILALDKRIVDHSLVSQYPTSAIFLTASLAIVTAACVYISVEKPSRQLIARRHLRV
jgi:peptidoglycan/LPS O-acetylase OafA/YrhL